jgi:outer membrane protein assembly factor BamC
MDPKTTKAHLERNGSDRWLVLNGNTQQVYAFIKSYLVESGMKISVEKADIGVIETDWLETQVKVEEAGLLGGFLSGLLNNTESASMRDRYTFRVDAGKEPGTVEVYVSHKGLEEVGIGLDSFKWQPRPSDPQKEAEMLKNLMVRFGVDKEKAAADAGVKPKTAEKSGAPPTAEKPRVIKGLLEARESGDSVIRISDSFDRAWRQVSLAVDKSGLTVNDQNRQDGVLYVQYNPAKIKGDDAFNPEKSGGGISGFFKSLWGSDDTKKASEAATTDVKFAENSAYRILVLKRGDALTEVVVQDREGKKLTPELARRFLSVLLAQELN